MNQQSVLNILLAVLVLTWILSRQLRARPLGEQRPYTLMVVLAAVGLYQVAQLAGHSSVSTAAYAALVAGLVSGAVFGCLRGRSIHLWRSDGVLVRQGNWFTLLLWVAGLALHLGLDEAGVWISPRTAGAASLGTAGILLYIGVTLAAQRVATLARARHLDGAVPAIGR